MQFRLNKKIIVLSTLSFLLFLSGMFDVWATMRLPHFRLLEANPIFLLTKDFALILTIKFLLLGIFCLSMIYFSSDKKIFKHSYLSFFFFISCFFLIIIQFGAGVNNIFLTNKILSNVRVSNINDLTYEDVQKFNIYSGYNKYFFYLGFTEKSF